MRKNDIGDDIDSILSLPNNMIMIWTSFDNIVNALNETNATHTPTWDRFFCDQSAQLMAERKAHNK